MIGPQPLITLTQDCWLALSWPMKRHLNEPRSGYWPSTIAGCEAPVRTDLLPRYLLYRSLYAPFRFRWLVQLEPLVQVPTILRPKMYPGSHKNVASPQKNVSGEPQKCCNGQEGFMARTVHFLLPHFCRLWAHFCRLRPYIFACLWGPPVQKWA